VIIKKKAARVKLAAVWDGVFPRPRLHYSVVSSACRPDRLRLYCVTTKKQIGYLNSRNRERPVNGGTGEVRILRKKMTPEHRSERSFRLGSVVLKFGIDTPRLHRCSVKLHT
jgi:hypothetical protein